MISRNPDAARPDDCIVTAGNAEGVAGGHIDRIVVTSERRIAVSSQGQRTVAALNGLIRAAQYHRFIVPDGERISISRDGHGIGATLDRESVTVACDTELAIAARKCNRTFVTGKTVAIATYGNGVAGSGCDRIAIAHQTHGASGCYGNERVV